MWNNALLAGSNRTLALELAAVESNVDIFQRLGSPVSPTIAVVRIRDTAAITTLTTGAMPAGSFLQIIHEGYMLGLGGNGGDGEDADLGSNPATAGQQGGTAFTMLCNVDIDLTQGYVWGGGGGGGGGAESGGDTGGDGGSGGVSGGLGGNGGQGSGSNGSDGNNAGTGISASPGAAVGNGGAGGDWGQPGAAGSGAAGGNSGISIDTNGFTLNFLQDTEGNLRSAGRLLGALG